MSNRDNEQNPGSGNEAEERSGLLYEDVPPEVYEDDDQIRVSDLINIVVDGKKKIFAITIFLFAFSIFHVVTAPKEYVAESFFLPERQVQQFQMDRMFAFGELSRALNIGGGQTDGSLPSYFYPDIVASINFQNELLAREVNLFNEGRTVTLFEYFTDVYEQPFRTRFYSAIRNNTIGLPMRFFRFITGIFTPAEEVRQMTIQPHQADEADPDHQPSVLDAHVQHNERFFVLSPQFENASRQLIPRILIDYGTLTIDVTTRMPDPMAAVQLNAFVADMLQEFLIDHRIGKAQQNLEYIESLYEEAEERYEETARQLALFTDSNKGNLTALAELEMERLRDQRNLAYSLYSSVANRLEEAKTRLKEETPIYTTFQDPIFPKQPTAGNILILPISIVLGVFFGIVWVFAEKLFLVFARSFSWMGSFSIGRNKEKEA